MSRPSEPYLWRNPKNGHAHIGSKYTDKFKGEGPCAEVYIDGPWLNIVTDKYESSVMILANTLPLLLQELRRLERAQRK